MKAVRVAHKLVYVHPHPKAGPCGLQQRESLRAACCTSLLCGTAVCEY